MPGFPILPDQDLRRRLRATFGFPAQLRGEGEEGLAPARRVVPNCILENLPGFAFERPIVIGSTPFEAQNHHVVQLAHVDRCHCPAPIDDDIILIAY